MLGKFSGINAETVVPNEVKWTEPVSGDVRVGHAFDLSSSRLTSLPEKTEK